MKHFDGLFARNEDDPEHARRQLLSVVLRHYRSRIDPAIPALDGHVRRIEAIGNPVTPREIADAAGILLRILLNVMGIGSGGPSGAHPNGVGSGGPSRGRNDERRRERRPSAANAHPTIRSEIALSLALAYYGQRDLDGAERELDAVSVDSDIIYARALEYRGWVATARSDHATSATAFKAAIEHLDQCRRRDQ